ncbi:hypothetical protein CP966_10960 [Streptomyces galilaeus]|uniref:hypothetical protein n=1 Tax=Streptomyces galilaeus TaxID=33899 RepID=UPI00123DCCC0|nr:hypothetical protein [Streptomyces galilaeus]QEU65751.1 hypothetical protein CP966_10960 [Streptomyces galilaeus]GGW52654.1 hypothetical protein GCM10010350_41360 [Streptomyces galilaeus]
MAAVAHELGHFHGSGYSAERSDRYGPQFIGAEEGGPGLPSVGSRIARLRLGAGQPAVLTLDAYRVDAIEDELRVPRGLLAKKVIQDCVHA